MTLPSIIIFKKGIIDKAYILKLDRTDTLNGITF